MHARFHGGGLLRTRSVFRHAKAGKEIQPVFRHVGFHGTKDCLFIRNFFYSGFAQWQHVMRDIRPEEESKPAQNTRQQFLSHKNISFNYASPGFREPCCYEKAAESM